MLLQEGFSPEFANFNVGNALRAMVFERLIAEKVKTYDFLAGVSRHKTNWSNGLSVDLRLEIARRTLRGRITHEGPRWAAGLRRRLSAVTGPMGTRLPPGAETSVGNE
jgi:CelD/BcsL family acetyltransferase involved in cellulose biosynthesis